MPRLRRSDHNGPGIMRRRHGRGFSYRLSTGEAVGDPAVLERISALAVPPAWTGVWICPWPNGHIQAVGTDAAGRLQYRYHDDWRRRRDLEKFAHMVEFGRALPELRSAVGRDLADDGLGRARVVAAAVRLLDVGCFRVGGEQYAEEHETFGVATLRKDHVTLRGSSLVFDYPAKGAKQRLLVVEDPDLRRVVGSLKRRRSGGDDLLAYKDAGRWVDVRSDDINLYIKEVGDFSAKDFRTWSATVLAAVTLAKAESRATSASSRSRAVAGAVREVSEFLGNTPAVCRASYIDPRVIDRFGSGDTVLPVLEALGDRMDPAAADTRHRIEEAVLELVAE